MLQVTFLINDRARLSEEMDVLKTIKFSSGETGENGLNVDGDMLSEIIKVFFYLIKRRSYFANYTCYYSCC